MMDNGGESRNMVSQNTLLPFFAVIDNMGKSIPAEPGTRVKSSHINFIEHI